MKKVKNLRLTPTNKVEPKFDISSPDSTGVRGDSAKLNESIIEMSLANEIIHAMDNLNIDDMAIAMKIPNNEYFSKIESEVTGEETNNTINPSHNENKNIQDISEN